MNSLFQANRRIRDITDEEYQVREQKILKLQITYGYNRVDAEKMLEVNEVKKVELMWSVFCGGVFAYRPWGLIQAKLEESHVLFRKAWMRYPLVTTAFCVGAYVGRQIPNRVHKLSNEGVSQETSQSRTDVVGRFRLFDKDASADASTAAVEHSLYDYLNEFSEEPLTGDRLKERLEKMERVGKTNFRIKRAGKDLNDMYWHFGKIHGLENIAYLSDEDLRYVVDPVEFQRRINKAKRPNTDGWTYDKWAAQMQKNLQEVKDIANKLPMENSDRKRILALPVYLAKRSKLPEPKQGQTELEIYRQLTGKDYYDDCGAFPVDHEHKITEFDYEKFLNPHLLKRVDDQDSEEFTNFVRVQNFNTSTKYERQQEDKSRFQELMSLFAGLDDYEKQALIHHVGNQGNQYGFGDEDLEDLFEEQTSTDLEEKLAQISEKENFDVKNRFRLNKTTLNYADKKRQPISESKVRDLLKNQHLYRDKIVTEIPTYDKQQNKTQFENGILTYLQEGTYGEMKDLIRDVGIRDETIEFVNLAMRNRNLDKLTHGHDHKFKYLNSALFTPLDMSDYDENFVSFKEGDGNPAFTQTYGIQDIDPESLPQTDKLGAFEIPDDPYIWGTGPTNTAINESLRAEPEEEEDDDDEEEEDEDYDEEEEGEEEEEEYDEEEEEEEERVWPPVGTPGKPLADNRVFDANDSIRERFTEQEIGDFMRLLNIKPQSQWQDTHGYYWRFGARRYEDTSQQYHDSFHTLAEAEREHAERIATKRWRRGSEVRFVVDGEKKPVFSGTRF